METPGFRATDVDRQAPPTRSNRLLLINGSWYFAIREGAPIGPFPDEPEARQALTDFIEFVLLAEPNTLSRLYASLAS